MFLYVRTCSTKSLYFSLPCSLSSSIFLMFTAICSVRVLFLFNYSVRLTIAVVKRNVVSETFCILSCSVSPLVPSAASTTSPVRATFSSLDKFVDFCILSRWRSLYTIILSLIAILKYPVFRIFTLNGLKRFFRLSSVEPVPDVLVKPHVNHDWNDISILPVDD